MQESAAFQCLLMPHFTFELIWLQYEHFIIIFCCLDLYDFGHWLLQLDIGYRTEQQWISDIKGQGIFPSFQLFLLCRPFLEYQISRFFALFSFLKSLLFTNSCVAGAKSVGRVEWILQLCEGRQQSPHDCLRECRPTYLYIKYIISVSPFIS